MSVQLVWRVSDVPSGPFRGFQKRAWPMAYFKGTDNAAVMLGCDQAYRPKDVADGTHPPLTVYIAQYNLPPGKGSFRWRKLVTTYTTLDDAKKAAVIAFDKHPQFIPKGTP